MNKDPQKKPSGAAQDKVWELSGRYKDRYEPDVERGLQQLKARMGDPKAKVRPLQPRRRWLTLVASIVFLLGLGAIWWLKTNTTNIPLLVDGTGPGQQNIVELADGTVVTLNENSQIKYPKKFNGTERIVELVGEAFFSVESDPSHPFIILTENTEVRVLGTSFNLRALPDEDFTEVEVASGTVEMVAKDGSQKMILQKKEKAVFHHEGTILRQKAPNLNAQSWKTQVLKFRDSPMTEVINAIERHFGVTFEIAKEEPILKCSYTTDFEKLELQSIIKNLEFSFGVDINRQSPNNYTLSGGGC